MVAMLSDTKAKNMMTREVLTARCDWNLDRLAEFFVEYAISGAPVTSEDGRLMGVVSATDLVRYRALPLKNPIAIGPHHFYLEPLSRDYADEEVENFRIDGNDDQATVKDIMTFAIFNVDEEAPLSEAAETMVRGGIHRVFVTRGERLVGIITALGILKALTNISEG